MNARIQKYIATGILAALFVLLDFYFFRQSAWFFPLIIVAFTVAFTPFWLEFFIKLQNQRDLEAKFPEFVRNLAGAIKSGMPAPRAIIHVSGIDYGGLTKYVRKLANQLEWSIPLHKALLNFGNDTRNKVIRRAIASVIEAEISGGNIEDVLESITSSVVEVKKLKERRMAMIHSQILQSYILFAVFLIVMIIIQNLLVPFISQMEQTQAPGLPSAGAGFIGAGLTGLTVPVKVQYTSVPAFVETFSKWLISLEGVFLMMTLIQGLFAGLVLGKLSEGSVIFGIKHALVLMTVSFFVITLSQGFL